MIKFPTSKMQVAVGG